MEKIIRKIALSALTIAIAATGCRKSEVTPLAKQDNSPLYINGKDYTTWQFVEETSRTWYYWDSNIPERIIYTNYRTPQDLFNKAIRHSDDHFSTITNNYTEVQKSFNNEVKTDGLNLELLNPEDDKVIAIVSYVYDNTPAAKSGLRRGAVITGINGTYLNLGNYYELLTMPSCTYTYKNSFMDEDGDIATGDELTTGLITKEECRINPILKVKYGVSNGRRYGYLAYDAFTETASEIMDAIAEIAAHNPSDLILDLRLNGGGYASTLDTVASMLVPDGNEGKIFLRSEYNSSVDSYLKKSEGSDYNIERFVKITPKLQLDNIYVIISDNTASASEELISGLSPYINIVTIGSQSYGKYTSNILVNNDMDGTDDNGIPYRDWAEYVTIAVCKNSAGEMKFKDGFVPDLPMDDPIVYDLGDPNEPLMKATLQLMGGSIAKKNISTKPIQGRKIGTHGKPALCKGAMIARR